MTDEVEVTSRDLGIGSTETFADEDHEPHVFLYVPDLADRTGWNTHRVPERRAERANERREMGFAPRYHR